MVLSREGPPREWLRLRYRSYFIADYRSVEELAAALERRGYSLADFTEVPGEDRDREQAPNDKAGPR